MATDLKSKGNEAFSNGEYKKAAKIYRDAIKLDKASPILYSNRAMCFVKLKDWPRVLTDCGDGLKLSPPAATKVKLLWRKGMAHVNLGENDKARVCYDLALSIDKTNKAVLKELNYLDTISNTTSQASEQQLHTVISIPITEIDILPADFGSLNSAIDTKMHDVKDVDQTNSRDENWHTNESIVNEIDVKFPDRPTTYFLSTLKDLPTHERKVAYFYIIQIPLSHYNSLFVGRGIDPDFLDFFLETILFFSKSKQDPCSNERMVDTLLSFTDFPRFDLSLLMCSDDHLKELRNLIAEGGDTKMRHQLSKISHIF